MGLHYLPTVKLVGFSVHMHLYMTRYVWRPQQSRRHSDPLLGESLDRLSLNAHPRYIFSQLEGVGREGGVTSGGGDRLGLPTIPGTPGEDAMVCCLNSPFNHCMTVFHSLHWHADRQFL